MSVVHIGLVVRQATILMTVLGCLIFSGCRSLSVNDSASSKIVSCRDQWQHGLEALQRQQWEEAELLFAGAVRTCPQDERARQYYADTLWHRGAWHEAMQQMQEAVTLSDGDPELLVRLGEMYFSLGYQNEAHVCVDEALGQQASLADAWALRGEIHWQRGERSAAMADYHRALSLQPAMPRVQLALTRIHYEANSPQEALTTLHVLKDSMPSAETSGEILYLEGLIYKSLHRYEESARSFRELAGKGKGGREIFYELANSELLSGHPDAARRAAETSLAWDSGYVPTLRLLTQIDITLERLAAKTRRLPE